MVFVTKTVWTMAIQTVACYVQNVIEENLWQILLEYRFLCVNVYIPARRCSVGRQRSE